MASQTGTLKFRQSDGTYTELYPKTTIAQVDGLQTQLDSINTSLQNKVGNYTQWNYLPEEDARITVHNTVNYYFSSIRPHLQMSGVGKETTFVQLSLSRTNYNSAVLKYEDTVTQTNSARLEINNKGVQYFVGTDITGQFLASQDYVTNAISGAIAASY